MIPRYLKNRLKHFLSLMGRVYPVRTRLPKATASSNGGFVALITVIILSVAMLTFVLTLNQSGFYTRSVILDAEYKERSSALAEACADTALLKLAVNPAYGGNETVSVGSDQCTIRPTKLGFPVSGQDTIEVSASFREAITNLNVVADATTFGVISWDEVAAF